MPQFMCKREPLPCLRILGVDVNDKLSVAPHKFTRYISVQKRVIYLNSQSFSQPIDINRGCTLGSFDFVKYRFHHSPSLS